jgi:hypothetical protein
MNRKWKSLMMLVLTLIGLVVLVGVTQHAQAQDQTQTQDDEDADTKDGTGEADEDVTDDDQKTGTEDDEDDSSDDPGAYAPTIDPASFVKPAEIGKTIQPNAYFLLVPGYTRIYKQGTETITVAVTQETKEIMGVTCAVIHDVVEDNGTVIEDTYDWYAQDKDGNIWYFGEATQKFENGSVTTEGSWEHGVDGALAGIVMWGKPEAKVGEAYRQEYYATHAEDWGKVLSLTESAATPAASCDGNCLVTEDTTPLEPDVLEHKYYAPGVGFIYELKPKTGETVELVEIRN